MNDTISYINDTYLEPNYIDPDYKIVICCSIKQPDDCDRLIQSILECEIRPDQITYPNPFKPEDGYNQALLMVTERFLSKIMVADIVFIITKPDRSIGCGVRYELATANMMNIPTIILCPVDEGFEIVQAEDITSME